MGVEGLVFNVHDVTGFIQEQQVLAFDIEDNGVRVFRIGQMPAVQQTVEQKGGIGRLGRDTGHAADIHMRALAAVQKIEVAVYDFLAGQGQADRELALHLVHEQGLRELFILDRTDRIARYRRIIILRYQAGYFDVRGDGEFNGQTAFRLNHVRVKRRALMACPDDIDHAEQFQRSVWRVGLDHDGIINLNSFAFFEPHPEFERGGVLRADDSPHAFSFPFGYTWFRRAFSIHRRTSLGSPSRCRSRRSSPPMGIKF